MFLTKTLKKYKKDTSGNVALMFSAAVFAVLIGVGVAVDTSMAAKTKLSLQNTADAAVLAAAKSGETDPAKLKRVAEDYINANYASDQGVSTSLSVTPNGRVRVNVATQYDTQIVGIIGRPSVDLSVESEAPLLSSEPVNIALVLDVTGSMRGAKLASLKTAANNLITTLEGYDSDSFKVSVVPFSQYVNVGVSRRNASWLDVPADTIGANPVVWTGCVGSRTAPWNKRVKFSGKKIPGLMTTKCSTEILPLTSDMTKVRATINSLTAKGSTYIPSGLAWGWRTLDTHQPLVEAKGPFEKNTKKVMILMTDGANTRSKTGLTHDGGATSTANDTTKKICRNIKGKNIELYTIAYEVSDTSTRKLLRRCASETTHYFDAANSAQLTEAFDVIGKSIIRVRLTH